MKQFLRHIFLLVAMFVATTNLFAQTYNGGTWYSLYDTGENSCVNRLSPDFAEKSVFAPAESMTFDYKKYSRLSSNGTVEVYNNVDGAGWQKKGEAAYSDRSNYKTSSVIVLDENISQIRYKLASGTGVYVKNHFVKLKKHILLESGTYGTKSTSVSFDDMIIGGISDAQVVKLRSFLTTGNITVTSSDNAFRINSASNLDGVTYAVGANACASANGNDGALAGGGTLGDIDQYAVSIYFCPTEAKDYSATITITDGVSTATINVSGKGLNKYTATFNWLLGNSYYVGDEVGLLDIYTLYDKDNKDIKSQFHNSIQFSSSNSNVVAIEEGKIVAKNAGKAKITAYFPGTNEWFSFTAEIDLTIYKRPTNFSLVALSSCYTGDEFDVASLFSDMTNNPEVAVEYISGDESILKVENGKLIAVCAGTTTFTVRQQENYKWLGHSQTLTITVNKYNSNFNLLQTQHTRKIGEVITEAQLYTHSNTEILPTVVSNNPEVVSFNASTRQLEAKTAGQAIITISQPEDCKWTHYNVTCTVTVQKHTPVFTWKNLVYFNQALIEDYFTTNNRDTKISITQQTDRDVADLYFSKTDPSDLHTLDLTTYNKAASTIVTVSQEENWYWYAKTEEHTITPIDPNNHVPFTMNTSSRRIALYDGKEENDGEITCSNDGEIKLDQNGGIAVWTANPLYYTIKFAGIPDKLTFKYKITLTATAIGETKKAFIVYESADGNIWNEVWTTGGMPNNTDYKSVDEPILLQPTTQYLKFFYDGTYTGYYSDITVTQRIEYEAVNDKTDVRTIDDDVLNFGTTQILNEHQTKQVILRYATPGYKVKLTTTDDRFSVSPTEITTIGGDNFDYYQPITVTYKKDKAHTTTNESKVIIKDERGKPVEEILLMGTTEKIQQNIQWVDKYKVDYPTLQVGEIVTEAATAVVEPVLYKSSNEDIIDVSADKKSFQAIAPGEATITAYQEGNEKYDYAEISKVFYVTNKQVQRIEWDQNLTYLFVGDDPISLTAKVFVNDAEVAERTERLQYMSGDESVVTVLGHSLNIVGAGTTTLTVSIAADEEFEAAAMSIPVRVMNHSAGCDVVVAYSGTTATGKLTWNEQQSGDKDITIDVSTGIPGRLSFTYRGVPFNIGGLWWLTGKISVSESADKVNWNTLKRDIYSTEDQHNDDILVDGITLSRDTRYIRFTRYDGESLIEHQGTYVISNIVITPAQFIEEQEDVPNEIDLGTVKAGSTLDTAYTISYSNVQTNPVLIYSTSSEIHIDEAEKNLVADCGAFGSQEKRFTFKPTQSGDFEGYIYVYDKNANCTTAIKVKAIVEKGIQQIIWNPETTILSESNDWRDDYTRNAYSNMGLTPITYSMESNEYAHFDENGNLVIDKKGGSVIIAASQAGNDNFYEASVSKEFEIPIPTFIGGADDRLWTTPSNWNIKRQPYETEEVIVKAEAEINKHIVAPEITFEAEGSIHITSQGGLTIGTGGIINAAVDGSSITIDNTPQGAGFLKVDPSTVNKPAKVTINYTTAAYNSGNPRDERWQYMGAPGRDMNIVADVDKTLIYNWSEQNGWLKYSSDELDPFAGYVFTQNKGTKDNPEASFQITATPIISEEIQEINLTVTPTGMGGSNLFANSFLAPIDVAKINLANDLEGVEGTFYLFNSGSWTQWQEQGGSTNEMLGDGTSPGQYYAITPGSAAMIDATQDQTTIPPMQGVYVIARENGAKIKLNYAEHVYAADANNTAMRAPQRTNDNFKRVRLQVNSQNSGADRMYVIQHNECTAGYDNGYDARNMAVNDQVAIYTHEAEGQMEISVSDNIDSTYIGFRAGSDTEYTLRMTSVVGDEMYLKDLVDDILIPVVDGQNYTFTAIPNSVNDTRFLLLGKRSNVSTDIEDVQLYVYDNIVHVLDAPMGSDMAIYTVGGLLMARYALGEAPCMVELSNLPNGVYLVRVADKAFKFVCK